MSYWAKIKAAALGSELPVATPPQQQVKKPAPAVVPPVAQPPANPEVAPVNSTPTGLQPPLPATPAVAPAPVPEVGNDILPEEVQKEKVKADALQSPLDMKFMQIITDFMKTPSYQSHAARAGEKPYAAALGGIFNVSDKSGRVWKKFLMQQALAKLPGTERYISPKAIDHWLGIEADKVGEALQSAIQARPEEFAKLVEENIGRANSQYGGQGLSLNQETRGKSDGAAEFGNFVGDDAHKDRLNQMEDDDYVEQDSQYVAPGRDEVANFWNNKTSSTIIAPTESAEETQQMREIFQSLSTFAGPQLQDIMHSIKSDQNSYQQLPPERRDKAMGQSIQWGLSGLSEMAKGDTAFTNWQEYLIKHKGVDPKTIAKLSKAVIDTEGQNTPQAQAARRQYQDMMYPIFEEIEALQDDPNAQLPLVGFMKQKAHEYMKIATDIHKTKQMLKETAFKPQPGDLESFGHMAQIAAGCALREYRYKKIYSQGDKRDGPGTALRRYAMMKTKYPLMLNKIKDVISGKQKFVLFGSDEEQNTKRYFHMGKNGNFYVRTVKFDKDIPLPDESDLASYINDKRIAKDEPLTTLNWSSIAGMVNVEQYVPQMLDLTQRHDVKGLRKQQSDRPPDVAPEHAERFIALQQKLTSANSAWLNSPEANTIVEGKALPDRLRDYRKALGQHIQEVMQKRQVGVEQVIQAVAANKIKKGGRLSNPKINGQWLQSILSGSPVLYSEADFQGLAEAISLASPNAPKLSQHDVFADNSDEYDKYSKGDLIHLVANEHTAPTVFARYLVHRKRVMLKKNMTDGTWSNKSLACFLQMSRLHRNMSTYDNGKGKPSSEALNHGRHLYDATGWEHALHPILPGLGDEPDRKIRTQEDASELANRMRGVPEKDLYDDLSLSKPQDTQLRPDGKGGFTETKVRAEPAEMYRAIMDGYLAQNPGTSPSEALLKMKQETLQEINQSIARKTQIVDKINQSMGDPQASVNLARAILQRSDYEVQGFINDLKKKTDSTNPEAMNAAKQQITEFTAQRLNQLATQNSQSPEDFSKNYLSTKLKQDTSSIELAKKRLEQVEAVNPDALMPKGDPLAKGKIKDSTPEEVALQKKRLQTVLDTIIPLKYKTRVPGTSNKPLDYVKTFSPVEASIELTVKTAESMDRLAAIKDRLMTLAMPYEFVDVLIDKVGEEYQKQVTLIARRANVRRDVYTATSKDRRRLWSLL